MAKTRKRGRRKTTPKKDYNTDIRGIIIIAISLIIALGIYTDSVGYLSYLSKKIFIGLFGIGAYIIPIYSIYLSINYIVNKGIITVNKVLIGLSLLIINTLLFIQVLNIDSYYDPSSFSNSVNRIITSESVFHAGIIGFSISLPIYKLIGPTGSYILYIAMYFISSIILFNFTLEDFGLKLKGLKPVMKERGNTEKVKGGDEYLTLKEATENEKEHKSFIGDIDDKIKILDFMKNNTIKDEIATDKHLENVKIITSDDNKPNTKEKKGLDNEVKETVSKEIEDVLSGKGESVQYTHPNTELLNLNKGSKMNKEDKKDLISNASKLEETLGSFGVDAKVVQVTKGPSVTRFELQPSPGVKVSKIVNLSDDIALGLAASGVRIEAPIPGKAAVGIEVPNKEQTPVFLREVLDSDEFKNKNGNVSFALGKDIAGKCVTTDLSKMPHLLIAGATGSGKSVCINALIISILYKYSPEDVKLLMVDPKVVELNVYNGIPHLLIPVVTDPKKAAAALNWAVNEMTRRYKLFADNGVRNIESYNALNSKGIVDEKLPFIVIIVDELADLMMVCPNDVEDYIARLAQMARAAGMHLVIATQRPSVDVITGVIKANIPSRISFAVSSQIDSRTILDSSGAEKLLGRGDMLFYPVGEAKPVRIQGAFISEEEVEQVVNFIKDGDKNQPNEYENEILEHINSEVKTSKQDQEVDELLDEAIKIVVESGQASTSYLQRRLRIGFNRAARIMDQLEENNIISPRDGSKPRQVLVSREDMENMN